jgi:threonine dehydratase
MPSTGSSTPRATLDTVLVSAPRLSDLLGREVILATETFQRTGSFKFRAAHHLAGHVPHATIITASSGNFGQALAHACALLGKHAIVVMPQTSAKVKVDAVRSYGAEVDLIDTASVTRRARVAEIADGHPEAYVASAYDDPLVIDGNSTLATELAAALPSTCRRIVVPVGGGGLCAGVIRGFQRAGRRMEVHGAEPALANDAARSLAAGHVITNDREPATLADGARTVSLGHHTWPILRDHVAQIVEVDEARIAEGVRVLFSHANLKAEPTGALALGALLIEDAVPGRDAVCAVVSGGNVDPELYAELLVGPRA